MPEDIRGEDFDLGAALAREDGSAVFRQVTDALRQGRQGLKTALDRGVAPDEFKRGQALLAGYDAALRGMDRAWEKRGKA